MTQYILCSLADELAPRISCGCRECRTARERALDPRLLTMAFYDRSSIRISASTEILHRALDAYLSGRLDYGALHMAIITALVELSDRQFGEIMRLVAIRPEAHVFGRVDKGADPGT